MQKRLAGGSDILFPELDVDAMWAIFILAFSKVESLCLFEPPPSSGRVGKPLKYGMYDTVLFKLVQYGMFWRV